jgi:hypothetical protein
VPDVGQVADINGNPLIVGTDGDLVVLRTLWQRWPLERDATEDLARLIVAASWEAAAEADDYREEAGEHA